MRHTGIVVSMVLQAVCGSSLDDIRRLNFALEVENAKNALFDSQVVHGAKPGTFTARALMRIGDHTKQYQSTLSASIKDAGGEPYVPCEYEFKLKDEKEFLDMVRGLETIGVQMNVGLVADMTKAKYRLELARILTTQGRHLAYVNQLSGIDPYPENSEDTVAPEQAMAFLQNYIKACPRTRESNNQRLYLHPNSGPPGTIISYTVPYYHRTRANSTNEDKMQVRRPFCVFIHSQRQVFVASYNQNRCKVPRDMPFGLAKVYITSVRRPVNSQFDSHILAGPALFDVRGSSMFPPSYPYPEPAMEVEDSVEPDTDSAPNLSDMLPPLQAFPMEPPLPLLPPIQSFPPVAQYPPLQPYPAGSPFPITAPQPVYPSMPPVMPVVAPVAVAPVVQPAPLYPPLAPISPYPGTYGKQTKAASEETPATAITEVGPSGSPSVSPASDQLGSSQPKP